MRLLVTGGAGFIGSNFIHYFLDKNPDAYIVNYDKLTYAGNLANLANIQDSTRYTFVKGDITDKELVNEVVYTHKVDTIVNFAAESHVDRSIASAITFIKTNIIGTQILLDIARDHDLRFVQISTDEVYGSLGNDGYFTETTTLAPNSPYSSSKASADLLVRSYYKTYGLDAIITRCSNNYGPYQFPEKLIPLLIIHALNGKNLPIYGDGRNIRDWLHVKDHCSAVDLVIHKGKAGEIYNIGGNNEYTNLEIAETIVHNLGKSKELITFVPDRLGHDYRYAIDSTKIKNELGWEPSYLFKDGLEETITWYKENHEWWNKLISS